MANGYPLSAVAGRAEIMHLMEEVFFSFTFGGEALSLAAAKATLTKLQREPVLATIRQKGNEIMTALKDLIEKHGIGDFVSVSGHPAWSFLVLKDTRASSQWHLKTLLLQEMFARGFLMYGTHNMSYAHSDGDIERLLAAYDEILPLLGNAAASGDVPSYLRCEPLKPLFKVR